MSLSKLCFRVVLVFACAACLAVNAHAQFHGAIQGTVMEEQIAHAAGAVTPQEEKVQSLVALIRDAGRMPVQRDTLYNVVRTFA